MLIAQGPCVFEENTSRVNAWIKEDGSITVIVEGENAIDDRTLDIPATSVDSDLRVRLGISKPLPAFKPKPPVGVYARGAKAKRAKRSWES